MKNYKLTDEHRKQLKPWAEAWIKIIMSTKPMDDNERDISRKAVKSLYKSAGLTPPPEHRIVFVSSPFIAKFVAGFASAIWYLRKNRKASILNANREATLATSTHNTLNDITADTLEATWIATAAATADATWDATWDATIKATVNATWNATSAATASATADTTSDAAWTATASATADATWDATRDATVGATVDATWNATSAATAAATRDAIRDATADATLDATASATASATEVATASATEVATWEATTEATSAATADATAAATEDAKWYNFPINLMIAVSNNLGLGKFGVTCANNVYRLHNGGNFWGQYVSYLSFFRYIVELDIDYSKFDAYEQLARHSSIRYMHEKFCIISDRPTTLKVNNNKQPHCSTGPFCEWSDGSKLYSLNGVRVKEWMVETPIEQLDSKRILSVKNVEQRAELIKRVGITKLFSSLPTRLLDTKDSYKLYAINFAGGVYPERIYLKMQNPSVDEIHIEAVSPDCTTVDQALSWRNWGELDIPYTAPDILT